MKDNLIDKEQLIDLKEKLLDAGFKDSGRVGYRGECASYCKTILSADNKTSLYSVICFVYDLSDMVAPENSINTGIVWSLINLSRLIPLDRVEMTIVDDVMTPTEMLQLADAMFDALLRKSTSLIKTLEADGSSINEGN